MVAVEKNQFDSRLLVFKFSNFLPAVGFTAGFQILGKLNTKNDSFLGKNAEMRTFYIVTLGL